MSAQPNQPKRPWLLRWRFRSHRTGQWTKWRVFASYTTEDAAHEAANRNANAWRSDGQFHVAHRDEPTDGASLRSPKVRTPTNPLNRKASSND